MILCMCGCVCVCMCEKFVYDDGDEEKYGDRA